MKKSKYRKNMFFKRLKKELNITNNDLKRKHYVKMNRYRRKYLIIEFNKFIDEWSKQRSVIEPTLAGKLDNDL